MKRKIHGFGRSFTAFAVMLCMLFSICAPTILAAPVAANEETEAVESGSKGDLNLVTFGASNVNGFGIQGYLPENVTDFGQKDSYNVYGYKRVPKGSYPDLLVNYFTEQGYNVNIDQLAMSSMRAEEVRVLLDNTYAGDAYTDWRFNGHNGWYHGAGKLAYAELNGIDVAGNVQHDEIKDIGFEDALEYLRQVYQQDVAEADYIIWDCGTNNFGVYLSGRVVDGSYNETIADLDPEIAKYYDEGKAYIFDLFAEYDAELYDKIIGFGAEHIIDSLAYCLVAYCVNYDLVMDRIYDLNPDVQVVAVSIQNLMKDLVATIPGIDFEIPLGDIINAVISAANTYIAVLSPYADKTLFANVSEDQHVTFFIDELADYNGDPTTLNQDMINCWRMYNGGNMIAAFEPFTFDENGNLIVPSRQIDILNSLGYGSLPTEIGYQIQLVVIDTLAKYLQSAAELNVLDFGCLAGGDWNAVSTTGMGAIEAAVTDEVFSFMGHIMTGGTLENYELVTVGDNFWEELAMANGIDISLMNTFAAYGVRTFIGNAFYAHPNKQGCREIADAIIATIENKTKGFEVVLGNVIDLVLEYYDDALLFAYEYALEKGYVDQAKAEIDKAIAYLEALAEAIVPPSCVVPTAATTIEDAEAALREQLANAIEEAKVTLEQISAAIITEIENADVDDVIAFMDTVKELSATFAEQMAEIVELITPYVEMVEDMLPPEVVEAIKEVANKVVEEVQKVVEKLEEKVDDYIEDVIEEDFHVLVDRLIKYLYENAPELAKAAYDYLYNNPNEVIDFILTYGEPIKDFLDENSEEVVALLTYLYENYGVAIIDYIMNNPCEVLKTLAKLVCEYGDEAIELIKVYIDATDLVELIKNNMPAVQEYLEKAIAKLETKLAELKDQLVIILEANKPEIEAAIADLQTQLAEKNAELAELQAQLEKAIAEKKAEAKSAVAALNEALAAKKAELETLVADLAIEANEAIRTEINNAITALQAEINGIVSEIAACNGNLEATVAAINATIGAKINAVKGEIAKINAAITANVQALAEILENAINATVDNTTALYSLVTSLNAEIAAKNAEIAALADALAAAIAEKNAAAAAAIEALEAALEAKQAELAELIAKLAAETDAKIRHEINVNINIVKTEIASLTAKISAAFAKLDAEIESITAEANAKIAEINAAIAEIEANIEANVNAAKALVEKVAAEIKEKIELANAEIAALRDKVNAAAEEIVAFAEAVRDLEVAINALVKATAEKAAEDIANAINAVTAAIEKINATVADVKEFADQLKLAIDNGIVAALELADYASQYASAVKALVEAYVESITVDLSIFDGAIAMAEELVAYAIEKLTTAAEAAVQQMIEKIVAAVAKYAPIAAENLYNYILNNPETVIKFVETYGPYVLAYGDEFASVAGYLVSTYGEDVAKFIVENREEIIFVLGYLVREYCDEAWVLVETYAEATGFTAAVEEMLNTAKAVIETEIVVLEAKLAELEATLAAAIAQKQAELEDLITEYVSAVTAEAKAAIEAKIAQVKAELAALKANLEAQIKAVKAQVETLRAELTAIVNEINAIVVAIAEFEAALNEFVGTLLNKAYDQLKTAAEKVKAAYAVLEKVVAGVEASIEVVKASAEKVAAAIAFINDNVDVIVNTANEIKFFAEQVNAIVTEILANTDKIDAFVSEKVEYIVTTAEEYASIIKESYEYAYSTYQNLYKKATSGFNYEANEDDSFYVALGDNVITSGETYVDLLTEYLNVESLNLGKAGITVEGMLEIIANNKASIANADLISIGFSNAAVLDFVKNCLANNVEVDWSKYFGEDVAKVAAELIENVKVAVAEQIRNKYSLFSAEETVSEIVDLLANGIQAYVYAYVAHVMAFPEVIETLRAIAPDALILIVAAYNEFEGAVVEANGFSIDIGAIFQVATDIINLESLVYAMFETNIAFIDATDVETRFEADVADGIRDNSIEEYINSIVNTANLLPSEAGHAYIFEAILEAVNVTYTASHVHVYDCECDVDCNECGAIRIAAPHNYYNDCDPDCNICGKIREVPEHVYTGACDATCNVCGAVREASAHTFGEWVVISESTVNTMGERVRKCTVCGVEERELLPILPYPTQSGTSTNANDGISSGAVVAIVIPSVIAAGAGAFSIVWFGVQKKTFAQLTGSIAKFFAKLGK